MSAAVHGVVFSNYGPSGFRAPGLAVDLADDRLAALVHMHMFHPDLLLLQAS